MLALCRVRDARSVRASGQSGVPRRIRDELPRAGERALDHSQAPRARCVARRLPLGFHAQKQIDPSANGRYKCRASMSEKDKPVSAEEKKPAPQPSGPPPKPPPKNPGFVTFTVDGREVVARPGTNMIEAAKSIGVEIPYYCWHPRLSIAANCRMCLVESSTSPKLVPACQTAIAEG